jgi:tRNA(Arg) A34 adenosine deaminase TadA
VSAFSEPAAERQRIYSLLTCALIFGYWNGNKRGAVGSYPWREKQQVGVGRYFGDQFGDRYLGHNIACIAVDENGEIIDFEFNHNELFNSSAEHAEARVIRRVFALNQIYDHWQTHASGETRDTKYANVFNGITIYTSLESCAQCSGMMALASCLRVVYLQADPGQNLVGNMLYNLTRPAPDPPSKSAMLDYSRPSPANRYWAPEPVNAVLFGFDYTARLEEAYLHFASTVKTNPAQYFFRGAVGGKVDASASITSFLCTDLARDVFATAAQEFSFFQPRYGDYRPSRSDGKTDGVFSNAEAAAHARAFLAHAITEAWRGTPHR